MRDALKSPTYYLYLANVFVGVATDLEAVESTSKSFTDGKIRFTSNTRPSSKYPSIKINNRSAAQYRKLIQDKYPGSSWKMHPSGDAELFISSNIKYVGRIKNNSGYKYVIDYYRNGVVVGKFRFNY